MYSDSSTNAWFISLKTRTRGLGWNTGWIESTLLTSLNWWNRWNYTCCSLPNILGRRVDWNSTWLMNQKLFQMVFVCVFDCRNWSFNWFAKILGFWFWERVTKHWLEQSKQQFMIVLKDSVIAPLHSPLPAKKERIYWEGRMGQFLGSL